MVGVADDDDDDDGDYVDDVCWTPASKHRDHGLIHVLNLCVENGGNAQRYFAC